VNDVLNEDPNKELIGNKGENSKLGRRFNKFEKYQS